MPIITHIPGCDKDSALEVEFFSCSSKDIREKTLFFAMKGEKRDGHEFLSEVKEKGAVGAVVSKEYQGDSFGLELFFVDDVKKSLQDLAKESIRKSPVFVVGVTGSVGKTTTKDFIATLLEKKFVLEKTPKSYNSQVSFPLNILNRKSETELLVLEMGMSKKGELETLVDIAPPDIAIITRVALAHAAEFPEGIAAIALEKEKIFRNEKTTIALCNHQLLEFPQEVSKPKITFSLSRKEADYFLFVANEKAYIDEKGVRATELPLPFKEMHLLEDFLAAASVARECKMSWDEIIARIPFLELPSMRFEKMCKKEVLFINDAYNANPESMKMALKSLPQPVLGGKRIAVLGEMRELGSFAKECHDEVGYCALETVDLLLCLGKECEGMFRIFKEAQKPAELFFEKESLAQRLSELMRPGDVVLVKGSRSMEMEKVFEYLV